MSRIVKQAFKRAGLFKENPDRVLTLHSLRHSYNSYMRCLLSDDDLLRALMGHKQGSKEMTDLYDGYEQEELLEYHADKLNIIDKVF